MHANALLTTALRPTPDCTPPDTDTDATRPRETTLLSLAHCLLAAHQPRGAARVLTGTLTGPPDSTSFRFSVQAHSLGALPHVAGGLGTVQVCTAGLGHAWRRTLLTASVADGDSEKVASLLAAGCSANAVDNTGTPMLHWAATNGRTAVAARW